MISIVNPRSGRIACCQPFCLDSPRVAQLPIACLLGLLFVIPFVLSCLLFTNILAQPGWLGFQDCWLSALLLSLAQTCLAQLPIACLAGLRVASLLAETCLDLRSCQWPPCLAGRPVVSPLAQTYLKLFSPAANSLGFGIVGCHPSCFDLSGLA